MEGNQEAQGLALVIEQTELPAIKLWIGVMAWNVKKWIVIVFQVIDYTKKTKTTNKQSPPPKSSSWKCFHKEKNISINFVTLAD